MANPFLAEIRIFAGNFAPVGWAMCNGQILPISQNTALFSLLGTTYGGDGKSNFALPNLQGCVPLQAGQGPNLSLRDLGEIGGEQTVTLLQTEMPAHSHTLQADGGRANNNSPANNALAPSATNIYSNAGPNEGMNPNSCSVAGGNLPHNNMQPFLGLNYIIALQGVYPARS